MAKLLTVSVDGLPAALENVSTGKAPKHLMISLTYKDGVSVEILIERYAVQQSAVLLARPLRGTIDQRCD